MMRQVVMGWVAALFLVFPARAAVVPGTALGSQASVIVRVETEALSAETLDRWQRLLGPVANVPQAAARGEQISEALRQLRERAPAVRQKLAEAGVEAIVVVVPTKPVSLEQLLATTRPADVSPPEGVIYLSAPDAAAAAVEQATREVFGELRAVAEAVGAPTGQAEPQDVTVKPLGEGWWLLQAPNLASPPAEPDLAMATLAEEAFEELGPGSIRLVALGDDVSREAVRELMVTPAGPMLGMLPVRLGETKAIGVRLDEWRGAPELSIHLLMPSVDAARRTRDAIDETVEKLSDLLSLGTNVQSDPARRQLMEQSNALLAMLDARPKQASVRLRLGEPFFATLAEVATLAHETMPPPSATNPPADTPEQVK